MRSLRQPVTFVKAAPAHADTANMTAKRPSDKANDRPATNECYCLVLHQATHGHSREAWFGSLFDAYEAAAAPDIGADDTWEVVRIPEPDLSETVVMRGTGPNTADRSSFEMYPTT